MRWGFRVALAATLLAGLAAGQTFDVASVKQGDSAGRPEVGNSNGRSTAKNATLKTIMATAYQVPAFQISGGPGWVDSDRFDIEAEASDLKTGYVQLRLMMRSLLEDRFHMKVHREIRVSSLFSLVVAKGGLKVKLSPDQMSPDASGSAGPTDGPPRGRILMGPGVIVANAVSLSLLAKVLTPEMERPILDRTDLIGRFDFRLTWMPGSGGAGAVNAEDLPSIFTALREQLGLELKSERGPVEFLVIDSAERPSPN
jgi:uncharacterized protein (TIGR03435 family)